MYMYVHLYIIQAQLLDYSDEEADVSAVSEIENSLTLEANYGDSGKPISLLSLQH